MALQLMDSLCNKLQMAQPGGGQGAHDNADVSTANGGDRGHDLYRRSGHIGAHPIVNFQGDVVSAPAVESVRASAAVHHTKQFDVL